MASLFVKGALEVVVGLVILTLVLDILGYLSILIGLALIHEAQREAIFLAYSQVGMYAFKGIVLLVLLAAKQKMVAVGFSIGIIIDFAFEFLPQLF